MNSDCIFSLNFWSRHPVTQKQLKDSKALGVFVWWKWAEIVFWWEWVFIPACQFDVVRPLPFCFLVFAFSPRLQFPCFLLVRFCVGVLDFTSLACWQFHFLVCILLLYFPSLPQHFCNSPTVTSCVSLPISLHYIVSLASACVSVPLAVGPLCTLSFSLVLLFLLLPCQIISILDSSWIQSAVPFVFLNSSFMSVDKIII